MGIARVGINAEGYLDKVKFIKLFFVNLVYAFSLDVGFVLRECLSITAIANTPTIKGITTNNENSGTEGVSNRVMSVVA